MATIQRWADQHQVEIGFVLGALTACACFLWWSIKIGMSIDIKTGTEKPIELFIQAIGAAGTVWAVVVALKQSQKRDAEEIAKRFQRAALAASGLHHELIGVETAIRLSIRLLKEISEFPGAPPTLHLKHLVRKSGELLENSSINKCDSKAAELIDLPNFCAHNLHASCNSLMHISSNIRACLDHKDGELLVKNYAKIVGKWISDINFARAQFEVAHTECKIAGKVVRPDIDVSDVLEWFEKNVQN